MFEKPLWSWAYTTQVPGRTFFRLQIRNSKHFVLLNSSPRRWGMKHTRFQSFWKFTLVKRESNGSSFKAKKYQYQSE